jgi:hypothetical protein
MFVSIDFLLPFFGDFSGRGMSAKPAAAATSISMEIQIIRFILGVSFQAEYLRKYISKVTDPERFGAVGFAG